jgi:hypothetical protein
MSAKNDLLEVAAVVAVVGGVVWYLEQQYQSAGGVVGLSTSLFSWAAGGTTPATPGDGALPDQTTLGAANGTMNPATPGSSGVLNSILNSSLTMQSIGM